MADTNLHWDTVYSTKEAGEVSWFQKEPVTSLRLLRRWASAGGSVLDIGAGDSTLVDSLLDAGVADITVLDVSVEALDKVRGRLGKRGEGVRFVVADVSAWQPLRTYDAWHDRAVFHFLVNQGDRDHYVEAATAAIVEGGVLLVGTFAADGPSQCSGLPAARYNSGELADAFGPAFVLEHSEREEHVTPRGSLQPFTWVVLRRTPNLLIRR